MNRLELTPAGSPAAERYNKIAYSPAAIDELLVARFLESQPRPPLHGKQEAHFFHIYYNRYCYLPPYIFCDRQLLCARLWPSKLDASAGSLKRPRPVRLSALRQTVRALAFREAPVSAFGLCFPSLTDPRRLAAVLPLPVASPERFRQQAGTNDAGISAEPAMKS